MYDLAIIGGGINGTGIAADASARGLSVFLAEQADLASATSSASSKMIHGGLRYLEHYEFGLVKESLSEREILLRNAPHLVQALRFKLPYLSHLRPAWLIRLGLFLYDHLAANRSLANSHYIHFDPQTSPLAPEIKLGFEYSDCVVDDSRLVIANAMAAAKNGAAINNYCKCISVENHQDHWHLTLKDSLTNELSFVQARALVNATGPWAQRFLEQIVKRPSPQKLRLVKGSHLVLPRQPIGDTGFLLQHSDKRVVFVVPYLREFTLLGTTDTPFSGDPASATIDQAESDYLCEIYNHYFKNDINEKDILASFAGVRPLYDDESDDPSAISRGYRLTLEKVAPELPLLSVFGGKLTTYRRLAEQAVDKLKSIFPLMAACSTHESLLPGGDNFADLKKKVSFRFPWLELPLLSRLVSSYGSNVFNLLGEAKDIADLGEHFGAGLYRAEVNYLVHEEWVKTSEDLLKRRSNLYLKLDSIDKTNLDTAIEKQRLTMV